MNPSELAPSKSYLSTKGNCWTLYWSLTMFDHAGMALIFFDVVWLVF